MTSKKLPFDTSWHSGDDTLMWSWYEELERLGPGNVRIRLMQHNAGSAGSIRGLGIELGITEGFVEDWLTYRDARRDAEKSDQETRRFMTTTWVAAAAAVMGAVAAIAASIAAWPVIQGWFGR